jgi:formamidopyrimidine-DNA glycosylase
MPELPEVETIRRGLELVLVSRLVERVDLHYTGSLIEPSPAVFKENLPGHTFTGTGRRGKYLLLYLNDDSVMVIHLRMTGRLVFTVDEMETDKHTHMIIHFRDQSGLYFSDVRKFGTIWWLPLHRLNEIHGLASLGPEPLSPDFHFPYLNREVEKRTVNIKTLLLNQTFVAGLGNIYTDEILHHSGIRPDRIARSLTRQERLTLFHAIGEVLEDAISWRGTTLNDYRDAQGQSGQFQEKLRVYQRHNLFCARCGGVISRTVVAGRGTHFCPCCQH